MTRQFRSFAWTQGRSPRVWFRHRNRILSAWVVILAATAAATRATTPVALTFNGSAYTQNFDALPYNNGASADVATNSTSINGNSYSIPAPPAAFSLSDPTNGIPGGTSLTGWYALGPSKNAYGASGGQNSTGAIYGYGAATGTDVSNRALGMVSTSTTGDNEVGVLLYNNTAGNLNQITLSYTAEVWRQSTAAKVLNFAYDLQPTAMALSPSLSGLTPVASLSTPTMATGAAQGSDSLTPAETANVNGVNLVATPLASTWSANTDLWLTWTMNSTAAGQGIAIDNLTFNAAFAPANDIWNTTSGNWDTTSTNWTGGSPNANQYVDGDNVTFNNQNGVGGTVNLTSNVAPGSTTVSAPAGTYSFTGAGIVGNGSLNKSGAGTLDLTAQNSNGYTGGTNVNGGWLVISNDNQLGSGSITMGGGTLLTAATISSTKTITLTSSSNSTIDTGVSASAVGAISGGGNFIVSGIGSLRLGSVNSYSGTTTINGGTLILSSTASLAAASAVTVNSGFFGGAGTVNGPVTVNPTATLFAGDGGIGSLTTASSVILSSGSSLQIKIQAPNPGPSPAEGVDNDVIVLGSSGTFSPRGANLQLLPAVSSFASQTFPVTYTIVDGTANTNTIDQNSAFANLPASNQQYSDGTSTYSVDYLPNEITLTVYAVPEPASLGLITIGSAALLRRRRERRK